MANRCHLKTEVGRQVFHLFLVHFQQCSYLSIVVRISLPGVECDDVAEFGTLKQFLLLFYLDISWHDHTAVGGDTTLQRVALLVQLTQVAGQRVVAAEHLDLLELTSLLGIHPNLVVNEVVVHLDGIVVNLVLAGQFCLKLWCHGNIEDEREGTVSSQILRLLLLAGQRFAQHLDLIITNITHQLVAQQTVDFVGFHLSAKLLLNHSHRHHARTEAREVSLLTIVF